ncbi:MAG: type III polyketide synthase, partial [Candidatus Cyclobacteriaceae bacterium M2_1C_046]
MSIYISSIGIANPKNEYNQRQLVDFMAHIHDMDEDEHRKLSALYRATGINTRYSVLKDFRMNGEYSLFKIKDADAAYPGTSDRMNTYKNDALALSKAAIENCMNGQKEDITHLITVSCTGFYAPGLDYELINEFNFSPSVERYTINFMGCFAAINALKAAWNICKGTPDAKVLIVCVELCSIHLQKEKTEDNFLANALFGDGAAAVVVSSQKPEKPALRINEFFSSILPEGEEDMAWKVTDFGFQMRLSQYVPDIIRNGIHKLSDSILDKFKREEIKNFLVHPGGKKILQVIEEHFKLSKEDNHYAYHVLKNYGNMSSPTILFVMYHFLNDLNNHEKGEKTLALAFGPGLTLESALLETV